MGLEDGGNLTPEEILKQEEATKKITQATPEQIESFKKDLLGSLEEREAELTRLIQERKTVEQENADNSLFPRYYLDCKEKERKNQ